MCLFNTPQSTHCRCLWYFGKFGVSATAFLSSSMVQVTTNPVIKIYVITVVVRCSDCVAGGGGPDYQGIRTTDGKLHGIVICKNHYLLTYLLTHSLTPWCRVLLEKITGLQLVKKFPAFYGTRRFITALTSVRHLSLSWASPIQSTYPHPTSWRSILMLSTHLRLGPPSSLFPSGFPTKTLYAPSPPPYAPHALPISFLSILSPAQYRVRSTELLVMQSPPFPLTPSLVGQNILLNTIFSNTHSFLSTLNVSDQASHPYKTTDKIVVLYILIFNFLDSNLEDKRFCTE